MEFENQAPFIVRNLNIERFLRKVKNDLDKKIFKSVTFKKMKSHEWEQKFDIGLKK